MSIDPRFPIGSYEPQPFSIEQKIEWLADLKFLPVHLENAVLNLDEQQLQTPYREGGWTVHQLVHHVAAVENTDGALDFAILDQRDQDAHH